MKLLEVKVHYHEIGVPYVKLFLENHEIVQKIHEIDRTLR